MSDLAKMSLVESVSVICSLNSNILMKALDDLISSSGLNLESDSSLVIVMEELLGISFKINGMTLNQKYAKYMRLSYDGAQFSVLHQECPMDEIYIASRLSMKKIVDKIPVSGDFSKFLLDFLNSATDELEAPKDLKEFGMIYKIRHDMILSEMLRGCPDALREPTFKKISELLMVKSDDEYVNLTPDAYLPAQRVILELGISLDPDSYEARKISYYNPALIDLNNKGCNLSLLVVIFPANGQSIESKCPDWLKVDFNKCKSILMRTMSYLQRIRIDPTVQRMINAYDFDLDYNSRLTISQGELHDGLKQYKNLFRTSDDLKDFMNRSGRFCDMFNPNLTFSDDILLNELTEYVLKNFNKLQDSFMPTSDVSKSWADFRMEMKIKENPIDGDIDKVKQTFPIPFVHYVERSDDLAPYDYCMKTLESWKPSSLVGSLINSLRETDRDAFHSSSTKNMLSMRKHLSPEIKYEMKIKGPGRKSAIKDGDAVALAESHKYNNFSYSLDCNLKPLNDVLEIMSVSSSSDIKNLNMIEDPEVKNSIVFKTAESCERLLSKTNQYAYLRLIELISREIALNGLRKRKNGRFLLICTNIESCLILIAPGAQLRSEGNPIWFKVLYAKEVFHNGLFPNRELHLDHYETSWISLDSDRIDHYMRINDKTTNLMFAMLQTSAKDNKYLDTLRNLLESGYYSLVGMINAEDKCSTSAMMQDVRYFIMKGLSFNRNFEESIKKLNVPIRSLFQIHLVNKLMEWTSKIIKLNPVALFSKRNPKFDEVSQMLNDESAGSSSHIPALFCDSVKDFHFSLNEMYFCMLFNKDQGNKTHGSLKILLKISKEERNLKLIGETLGDPDYYMGYKDDDLSFIKSILQNGHLSHQYSSRMISIGSKLQRNSNHNSKPEALHFLACNNSGTTKPLDSFSTFKASTTSICKKLNDDFSTLSMENTRIKLLGEIGVRSKCVEEMLKLMESPDFPEIHRLDEFCNSYKNKMDIMIQIFRKNQIGGTREILILDIISRMLINYVESISRYVCEQDDREMLTKGKSKLTKMRDNYLEIMAETQSNNLICENADMTTWAQMFMPFQFLYMFTPFAEEMGDSFNFVALLLAAHQNKKIEYPRELVLQWLKHDKPHDDPSLEFYRQKFMTDREPFMINESNMGQGILHFTSSYLHLCLISLRDEIMKRVIARFNNFPILSVKTQVSSDDRLTMRGLPKMNLSKTRAVVMLHSACSKVSDILFGVKKSPHKTSDGPNLHEFNSAFASSFSTYSPLIKFAINAAPVPDSRSFQRMVNELYATVRQYRENGASSLLTLQAHLMNKRFAESVYHTHPEGMNAPEELLSLNRRLIPYDLGIYPIFNPSLMELVGPEYYNYRLVGMDPSSDSLLANLYSSAGYLVESVATTMFEDDNKKLRSDTIECSMGPIRRLTVARSRSSVNRDDLNDWITNDMMAPFRKTTSKKDAIMKTTLRLYTPGAADTFRRTSYSLFYARNSASSSAACFQFKGCDGLLYSDAVKMTTQKCKELTSEDLLFYFPNSHTYEIFRGLEFDDKIDWELKPVQMPISVRKLKTTDDYEVLENRFVELFDYIYHGKTSFSDEKISSLNRDWLKVRSILPFMSQSLNDMKSRLQLSDERMIQLMTTISYRFMRSPRNYSKMYVYGRDTNDVMRTMELIFQYNHLPAMRSLVPVTKPVGVISFEIETIWRQLISLVSLCLIDKEDGNVIGIVKDVLSKTVDLGFIKYQLIKSLERCSTSRRFSMVEKKWIMMIGYIITNYDIELLQHLMDENSAIKYSWIKSQKRNKKGEYYGDLEVFTSYKGTHILTSQVNGVYRFQIPARELNPQKSKSLYQHFCQLNQLLHGEKGFSPKFYREYGNFSVIHPSGKRFGEVRFLNPPVGDRIFVAHLRENVPMLSDVASNEIEYRFDKKNKSIKVGYEREGKFMIMSNIRLFFPMVSGSGHVKIIRDHQIAGFSLKWLFENDIITKSYNLPIITEREIKMIPKLSDMKIDMRPLENLAARNFITKKKFRSIEMTFIDQRWDVEQEDGSELIQNEYEDEFIPYEGPGFLEEDDDTESEDDDEGSTDDQTKDPEKFLENFEAGIDAAFDDFNFEEFDIGEDNLNDIFDDSRVDDYMGFLDEFKVEDTKRTMIFNWRSIVSRLNNLSSALQLKVLMNEDKVFDVDELYSLLLFSACKADDSDIFMYIAMTCSNLICSLNLQSSGFKIRNAYDSRTPEFINRESFLRSLRPELFNEEDVE